MLSKECIVATIGRFVESRNAPASQACGLRPSRAQERSREPSVGPTPSRSKRLGPSHVIPEASAATEPKTVPGCLCPLRFSASRMPQTMPGGLRPLSFSAKRMDKTAPGGLRPLRFSRSVELRGTKRCERGWADLGWLWLLRGFLAARCCLYDRDWNSGVRRLRCRRFCACQRRPATGTWRSGPVPSLPLC